jgi:hypothetical protein
MYPETKEAVRRTLRVCQILWSMDDCEYIRLLEATDKIEFPNRHGIAVNLQEKFKDEVINNEEFEHLVDAALIEELRIKYSEVAIEAGFDAEQGLAMLEYAAILRDLEDGYEEP